MHSFADISSDPNSTVAQFIETLLECADFGSSIDAQSIIGLIERLQPSEAERDQILRYAMKGWVTAARHQTSNSTEWGKLVTHLKPQPVKV